MGDVRAAGGAGRADGQMHCVAQPNEMRLQGLFLLGTYGSGQRRAIRHHFGVFSTCVGQSHQLRRRNRLSLDPDEEAKADHKNKQLSKGDGPHAESIRPTLQSFKMSYRLVALFLLLGIL
jgi:hypothetical protein